MPRGRPFGHKAAPGAKHRAEHLTTSTLEGITVATINSEAPAATRQLCGPLVDQMGAHGRNWAAWAGDPMFPQPAVEIHDFGDSRLFVVHDGGRCGEAGLACEQSNSGPTFAFIADDVPEGVLACFATRHGLLLDELLAFRDGLDKDIILASRPIPLQ